MSEYCFIIVKLNNNLSTNNLHYKHQPTINIIQNNLLGSTEGTSIHFICQRWSDDFYCFKSESGFFLRRPALMMKISHLRYLVLIEKSGSNFLIWLQTDLDATDVRYLRFAAWAIPISDRLKTASACRKKSTYHHKNIITAYRIINFPLWNSPAFWSFDQSIRKNQFVRFKRTLSNSNRTRTYNH